MRVVACLIAATLATGTLPQNTVRDMVRRTGDVELVLHFEYEPAYIKELVQKSTLVARVIIRAERVHLTDDQESVVTDYDVELIQVVRNKISPEKSIITVRKPGGILSLDGHTVTAIEQDFPPFLVGVEYLLCLARSKDGFFETVYGAQGAFKLEGDMAMQMSRYRAVWQREEADGRPVPTESLLRRIRTEPDSSDR